LKTLYCAHFFISDRVLMSGLKYLSHCPCPRCLVLKTNFPLLGSRRDMNDRVKLRRVDNTARQQAVEHARRLLFEKGVSIGNKQISDILGAQSLVPTRVCLRLYIDSSSNQLLYRMHFHSVCLKQDSTSMSYLLWTSFMSLKMVYGWQLSNIYCGFFMHLVRIAFRY
jgi:hypothetical protein